MKRKGAEHVDPDLGPSPAKKMNYSAVAQRIMVSCLG